MSYDLNDLRQRYQNLPFTQAFWASHVNTLDLSNYRGQTHYLQQRTDQNAYADGVRMIRDYDQWNLLEKLQEDDAFGVFHFDVDGKTVSRDLLDSIYELNFIAKKLGWSQDQAVNILDVGAGYGRLAHRVTEAMPNANVFCVDAVPESTFVCEQYLEHRNVYRGHVIPFDDLYTLEAEQFDVATAIHSFSECNDQCVAWWGRTLHDLNVPHILYVSGVLNTYLWGSGGGSSLESVLGSAGYRLDEVTQGDMDPGIYFAWFSL